MKKWKLSLRLLFAIILVSGLLQISANGLSEWPFIFPFPDYFGGSIQTSTAYTRTSGIPYVDTDVASISTYYFLSPSASLTYATEVKNVTIKDTYHFTWKSGYGGTGQSYRLCAHTNPANGAWPAYTVTGHWAE